MISDSNDLVEIAIGADREAVRIEAEAWLAARGIDMPGLPRDDLRVDVGTELDGSTYYRVMVRKGMLESR